MGAPGGGKRTGSSPTKATPVPPRISSYTLISPRGRAAARAWVPLRSVARNSPRVDGRLRIVVAGVRAVHAQLLVLRGGGVAPQRRLLARDAVVAADGVGVA